MGVAREEESSFQMEYRHVQCHSARREASEPWLQGWEGLGTGCVIATRESTHRCASEALVEAQQEHHKEG